MKIKNSNLNLIVIILCSFASFNNVLADCDPVCKTTKFKYIGCDMTTKSIKAICTDDPRGTANFRPLKKCFPMSITIETWPRTDWGVFYRDFNGDKQPQSNEIIFDYLEAEDIIYNGLDVWSSICTPDNQNCDDCPPKVIWARREEDMKGYPDGLAVTYQTLTGPAGGSSCNIDCIFSYIAINMTDRFFDFPMFSSTPRNWFYTNRTGPHDDVDWFDLQSIIEHEMGHWLGFDDDQQGCNSSYSGLMNTPIESNSTQSITNSDRCMFEKLYCCPANSTSVEEEIPTINSTFNIYPNPTSSIVTVSLSPSAAQYVKSLRIVDIDGKTVFEQMFPAGNSDCTVITNELSKGSYLFVMTFDGINGSYAEKVIVQ